MATEILHGGEAVLIGFEKIDKKWLDARPNLKVIGFPGTGLDHIDLEECERRNIKVISLKGETSFLENIPSVSELTVWFMLELLRRPHKGRFIGNQLKDKCVAILGLGRIGSQVRRRVESFEAFVIWKDNGWGMKFEELLNKADILTLHVPLNKRTEGMLTEEHLKMLKPSAVVVNTSRSQIIKEGAIEMAIKEKWIAGYGTDVVRDEKELKSFEQLQKDGYNVIITEHVAGNTVEALKATRNFIKEKVEEFLNNNSGLSN